MITNARFALEVQLAKGFISCKGNEDIRLQRALDMKSEVASDLDKLGVKYQYAPANGLWYRLLIPCVSCGVEWKFFLHAYRGHLRCLGCGLDVPDALKSGYCPETRTRRRAMGEFCVGDLVEWTHISGRRGFINMNAVTGFIHEIVDGNARCRRGKNGKKDYWVSLEALGRPGDRRGIRPMQHIIPVLAEVMGYNENRG